MNMLGVKNPPKNCFPSVKGGGDAPFSVKKFPENIVHGLRFFTTPLISCIYMFFNDVPMVVSHPDGGPSARGIPPETRHWNGKSIEESKVSFSAVTFFKI